MNEKRQHFAKPKMKSEDISWLREHMRFMILSVVIACSFPLLMRIAFLYGVVSILEQEVLTALLEVEATMLGFFGIIFIYALTSFDNRIERLERYFFKLKEEESNVFEKSVIVDEWHKAVTNVGNKKRELINHSLVTGFGLVLSLLSTILALEVPNEEWGFYLSSFSVGLLFVCLFQIFWAVYDLGKDPAQATKATKSSPIVSEN